jgi:hypothetical protein
LGGLDAAADLAEIFVEQDQVLTDLKIKAEASYVAMKGRLMKSRVSRNK